MSVVLQFPARSGDAQLPKHYGRPAEVVIFPGVRFERCSFDSVKTKPTLRKTRNQHSFREEDSA